MSAPSRTRHSASSERRGFALVATLMLMILLTVIAVGLLTLSSVSLRSSQHEQLRVQARANARLALTMAIGQLQKHAGPDTRVTANASLQGVGGSNPYWLGVWQTRDGENLAADLPGVYPVGFHANESYMNDLRGSTAPTALQWLVSSPEPAGASPTGNLGARPVTLLDTGNPNTTVNVPRITLDTRNSCAWWVSDENQKARIDLADPHLASSNDSVFSLIAAQDSDLESYTPTPASGEPLAGLSSASAAQLDAVISLESAALVQGIQDKEQYMDSLPESFHHITTSSLGLFTDVKQSGLKRDLSAFLATGQIAPDTAKGLPGIDESTPILSGTKHTKTGPRFGILKGWSDLAFELDTDSGNAAITPQPPATYYQNLSGSIGGHVRDLTNVSKPAVQPVVVELSLGWDFSPYTRQTGGDFLRAHIYPRLILWNPFNVTLESTSYLAMMRHPGQGQVDIRGTRVRTPGSGALLFSSLCGTPQQAFLGFVTEPVSLQPGETKIFTPSIQASAGPDLHDKAALFDPVNFSSNVLTADQIPGVENFYYDTTVPLPAQTTANQNTAYGFSSDVNSFISTPGFDDEHLVIQLPSGGGNASLATVTANNDSFPQVDHFLCQKWGLNRYSKWYGAQKSNHASNNGTPFREFVPGASGIGALENRRPPRLWRRGVRMAWIDDTAEYIALSGRAPAVPKGRLTQPWLYSSNLRGGLYHHPGWATIPFDHSFKEPFFDSHMYFLQPTDPNLFSSFFPPSPFGAPDEGLPSTCVIYDIPRRKSGIISLGQLQHAQMSYCSWHPSLVIGHSQATVTADLDATAIKDKVNETDRWERDKYDTNKSRYWTYDDVIQKGSSGATHDNEVLVYDLCFEANEALWDAFMLSSIPYSDAKQNRTITWSPTDPLPVGRYLYQPSADYPLAELTADLERDPAHPYFHAAAFLTNRGAFNINSTSVQAWMAILGSMRGLPRESLTGGPSVGEHQLSRSVVSHSPGSAEITAAQDTAAWDAFRSLSDSEIETLANAIVAQVKKRGPFLSVSDFINRRLTTDRGLASCGTLDQAILDSAAINGSLQSQYPTELNEIGNVKTAANRPTSVAQGIPGHFTQGDLLNALAPVITARGDTFKIRAYGEARAADGSTTKAWCEAVVQRTADYLDPADSPTLPAIDTTSGTPAIGQLSLTNLAFGRRFEIRSFRWLTEAEI